MAERATAEIVPFGPLAEREAEDRQRQMRIVEALLFAAAEPLGEDVLAERLPSGADVPALIRDLQATYAGRGVELRHVAGKWAFRTAGDLSYLMRREVEELRRLSRPALETLAIIAYHQPVTRAEIEEIRGVSTSRGTVDVLLETGWIRMRGRRRTPGRPVTYGTTEAFLDHFGLAALADLPGLEELKGAGLLDISGSLGPPLPRPPAGDELTADEDPLDETLLFTDIEPEQER
ncbi:MAG: SMC-Scp complex subunit ScpB [Bauldia sp.]|nr:SMC-Scp complex subunit ScpB [Bauldia sp.]